MKVCEICSKPFSNGKALGGHMRSHMAKLRLPPIETISQSASSSPYHNNTFQMADSETESDDSSYYKKRKAMRADGSKRRRLSAVDEVLSVEEAAMFLMELSKGTWCRKKVEEENNGKVKAVFRCGTCRKVFSSYQALGGHKANHKKIKKYNHGDDGEEDEDQKSWVEESESSALALPEQKKLFHCSFCSKVFSSGQALGGHKKIHYTTNLPIIASTSSRRFNLMIDLNKFPLEVE